MATILAGNAVAVGLALGRWRGALIPYIPQLPSNTSRPQRQPPRGSTPAGTPPAARPGSRRPYAAATIGLTAAAAAIEVLLTPHAR